MLGEDEQTPEDEQLLEDQGGGPTESAAQPELEPQVGPHEKAVRKSRKLDQNSQTSLSLEEISGLYPAEVLLHSREALLRGGVEYRLKIQKRPMPSKGIASQPVHAASTEA